MKNFLSAKDIFFVVCFEIKNNCKCKTKLNDESSILITLKVQKSVLEPSKNWLTCER